MSSITPRATAIPKPGMRAVPRLATSKRPTPSSTSIRRPSATPVPVPVPPKPAANFPKASSCPNPGCPAPEIVEDDGQKVCAGCGTVINDSQIVSEIAFGETSAGAAVVQGAFVGVDQSSTRGSGPGFQRGNMESREVTEQNGNRYIAQLSRALNIPDSAQKSAGQVFKLAAGLNFIQGRRTRSVAAVCLYIACRRQEGNTVMLIDFADILNLNVFKLGRTYKALLSELRLGGNVFFMNPIDAESLIYRFAKQLEFGTLTMRVASEAVRIVQRMNRDWMTTGRRPAGICGAALILASRMNNFRRTLREVVYVVKVTELTLNQRLNEFKQTESGTLTVDQFRSVNLENAADPPAFTRARENTKKQAPRKSHVVVHDGGNDAAAQTGRSEAEPKETAATTTTTPATQPNRIDADGFAIPNPPIDPAMLGKGQEQDAGAGEDENEENEDPDHNNSSPQKRKRGRPKGWKPMPIVIPNDVVASEQALEAEMSGLLEGDELPSVPVYSQPPQPSTFPQSTQTVSSSENIDESEFDDDPEVSGCLLLPHEVQIKEALWVTENKEFLRAQQAKAIRKALAAKDAEENGTGLSRPRKRRKHTRMGDVTYLNGEEGDGGDSRASTPAEATRRMLERRGFSKKINYRLFEGLYGDDPENESQNQNRTATEPASEKSVGPVLDEVEEVGVPKVQPKSQSKPRIENCAPPPKTQPPPSPPPSAQPQPQPQSQAQSQPQPPHPDEEILGEIAGPPEGEEEEGDDDDFDDEEEGDEENQDEDLDAAFEGQYDADEYDYDGYSD